MRPILRTILITASLVAAAGSVSLAPSVAWAGPNSEEIWFGTGVDSLETDDDGKVTSEGEKTKTKEVDQMPDEEDWELKVHARMGKYAAAGPVYTEFYQTVQGKEYIVYRHEDPDYEGSRLYTAVILLEGNIGFNKNREYRVQMVQNNGSRDLVLAKGKVKLIDTGRTAEVEEEEGEEPEEGEGEGDEGEDAEGDEDEDEDEGEGDAGEGAGSGEAPPPIEETPASKKGCTVASGGALDVGFSGLAILLLAGAARRRRD